MAAAETDSVMPDEGRALLTEREREILSGEADVSDNYRYKVQSTVRNRIRKRLSRDVAFLEEHFPEVHELVIADVCGDADVAELEARIEAATERAEATRDAIENVNGDDAHALAEETVAILEGEDD